MRRAALLLAFAALLASSCRARSRPAEIAFPGAPVVLISIDTLRADHLPAYGYAGVETPALDRFRRDAILFRNAFSPCPMTLPSHVTMLTGLLPPEHGVRTNVGFEVKAVDSLPARLRARGYATGAAVSAYVLRRETGLGALFDWYDDAIDPGPGAAFADYQRPGDVAASLVSDWIAARGAPPFFAFLHLYEPHVPYEPPEPFRSRYAEKPYDGEIAAADAIVGRFLDRLRASGLYDGALVIVTSDHGEGLGDHGEAQHSILLYVEDIRVPLLVKLPGAARAGTTVDAPAQLADILPTVMEVVGGGAPGGKGTSLLHIDGAPARTLYAETLYPRLQLGWSELRSLTDARAHYIAGPRPELFDLASDPRETRDLVGAQGTRAAALQRALDASFPLRLSAPAAVDPRRPSA